MGWNNGMERKKFEERMKKQAKEYREAGMTEEQIRAMYEFDLAQFKSDRAYYTHTQPLDVCEVNEDGDEVDDFFIRQYFDAFATYDDNKILMKRSRFGWIETIENPDLAQELRKMCLLDKEILTRLAFEGYKLIQLESALHVPYRTLKYHLSDIKKKISKFFC